jgi:hypothetical protein
MYGALCGMVAGLFVVFIVTMSADSHRPGASLPTPGQDSSRVGGLAAAPQTTTIAIGVPPAIQPLVSVASDQVAVGDLEGAAQTADLIRDGEQRDCVAYLMIQQILVPGAPQDSSRLAAALNLAEGIGNDMLKASALSGIARSASQVTSGLTSALDPAHLFRRAARTALRFQDAPGDSAGLPTPRGISLQVANGAPKALGWPVGLGAFGFVLASLCRPPLEAIGKAHTAAICHGIGDPSLNLILRQLDEDGKQAAAQPAVAAVSSAEGSIEATSLSGVTDDHQLAA